MGRFKSQLSHRQNLGFLALGTNFNHFIMKIFSTITSLCLLAIMVFSGCEKKDVVYSDYELVSPDQSFVKVNYNVAFYNNPGVQIKINGTRVSTGIQTRYPFPGGGFNTLGGSTGDYLPVTPGKVEVSLSIPKRNSNVDSVEIYKTILDAVSGKKYSIHVADTLVRKGLVVDEDAVSPDSGFVKYRFTHLMPNVGPLDLYNGTTKVCSNISFMGISDVFLLPTGAPTGNAWSIRLSSASPTSTALATYTSASTILNQRVYTVFATGYSGYSTTVAPLDLRRPFVSFYYVR